MSEICYVTIGNCVWEKSPATLLCKGLGSCLAISFYDTERKEGCLVHVLLPYSEQSEAPFYYVNLAIAEIAKRFNSRIKAQKIVSKLCGGANIFPVTGKSVGERNIEAAKYWLAYYNITIVGEDVGGNEGRNVVFEMSSGNMIVSTIKRGSIII